MLPCVTRTRILIISTLALLLAAATTVARPPDAFTVHEWGTFLAMEGSDGVTLDGMYHEEHSLPGFVHARSKDQLHVPSVSVKGETPVIYFYTDRERELDVRVRFPQGIWTQWYPQADFNGPATAEAGTPPELKNGHISWRVRVTPPQPGMAARLPKTDSDSLWRFARDVDAAYVSPAADEDPKTRELERFVFYRGLGHADLPVTMSAAGNGRLSHAQGDRTALRHLFVIRVSHGHGAYRYFKELMPGQTLSDVLPAVPLTGSMDTFISAISEDLTQRLVDSGLYPREATAMVNTWRHSYFETEGTRVLFIMPQEWTGRFIPMTISPKPAHLTRVMVGRLEALTPEREAAAEAAVRDLAAPDSAKREAAYALLTAQGRYLEPILRRTLKTAESQTARGLCRRLLLSDFVTELHAAVSDGRGGKDRLAELDARAQLSSLLREVGLTEQAAEEARSVQREMAGMQRPSITMPSFRMYARIQARLCEGAGDGAGAAKWYGTFVQFGSQSTHCGGCHATQGPNGMAWYRDWWAGRRFARFAAQTAGADAAISQVRESLRAEPDDTAARMKLAYLYEEKGERARADEIWERLTGH